MDTIESTTGTPNTVLLRSEFSTCRGALQGMSQCANRAYLGDVDVIAGIVSPRGRNAVHTAAVRRIENGSGLRSIQALAGRPTLATSHRSTHVTAARPCSAFQEVHPRA